MLFPCNIAQPLQRGNTPHPRPANAAVSRRASSSVASRRNIEVVCVTNSSVQADICRRKFARLGGRGQVIVTDFDSLDLPSESFDAIYSLESIGYTEDRLAHLAATNPMFAELLDGIDQAGDQCTLHNVDLCANNADWIIRNDTCSAFTNKTPSGAGPASGTAH